MTTYTYYLTDPEDVHHGSEEFNQCIEEVTNNVKDALSAIETLDPQGKCEELNAVWVALDNVLSAIKFNT